MLRIRFMYRDNLSNGLWKTQECVCGTVIECIEWYGLGVDCEYKIISVEEID